MPDRPLALAGAMRERVPAFAAWVGSPDPVVAETLVREGFDAAVLDMQHGGFDIRTVASAIGTCALAAKPAIVRIPVGDFATASRVLDAGAAAVIAPMINSADDARRFVAFTKYPPLGERSWGPGRATAIADLAGRDYLREANGLHLAIAMIETVAGFQNLDAILAVPGIDGVFVGPSDLSIGMSRGADLDPRSMEVDGALVRIEASARSAGKFAGLFCFTGQEAARMAARGFGLISIATDLLLLRQAARAELAAARRPQASGTSAPDSH